MQMGPKEIAVEYRTAANKNKQITVLAELNQVAERKIAEILAAEGEELPKKWQEQLQKPGRRSRKFPEAVGADASTSPGPEPEPEAETPAPLSPAKPATDRDIFDAVAALLPEPVGAASASPEPERCENADPEPPRPEVEPTGDVILGEVAVGSLITSEDVCLGACKNLLAALDLKPDEFHCYACGTLDLVFSLLGVPMV